MASTTPRNTAPQSTGRTTTSRTAPTRTIDVAGTPFVYRELGPRGGVPVVFLHHFTAVLDDWDPRVIDGIAARRHVIAFDTRGVGGSGGSVRTPSTRWRKTRSRSSTPWATTTLACSASRSEAASRR